ncbi:hypothetical protein ANANG_G00293830 [Anguilla anguilla]|uniref:G-protein coupled receptors family 3 profile domain-containing protein n=1 Tax=Anguilla anguilla TaxID=7936 RepID=A0A9D3RJA4_ANGAN|nr:hypothetical protein ANANG_G00293830 [Anguilla anguilla]
MDRTLPLALLPSFTASLWSLPGVRATNSTPYGCSPAVSVLHYNLCDLDAVWGVVVEALAAAGAVTAFILLVVLVASLPFVTAEGRRSAVGLQAGLLVCTLGLFGLAFAFILGRDFAVCVARRFLFGVLFAGCFSCLLAHAPVPCAVTNPDFAMALIYVMVLLLAVPVAAAAALGGGHAEWRRPAAFILLTGVLSAGIWVAWVVMYVYGNRAHGGPGWDDPALAIALVTNGWVFLALYVIPEVAALQGDSKDPETPEGDSYPPERVGYETILNGQKDQSSHNVYVENKGFTMDEPNTAGRPVSPYSGYNGQIRGCVYQPTELALITKGLSSRMDNSRESGPPWVTSASLPQSSWSYTARPDERRPVPGQSHGGGNGLQVRPMW